jgi:hypothetical protein
MTASCPLLRQHATASERWLLAVGLLLSGCFGSEKAPHPLRAEAATWSRSQPGGFSRQEITVVAADRAQAATYPDA